MDLYYGIPRFVTRALGNFPQGVMYGIPLNANSNHNIKNNRVSA